VHILLIDIVISIANFTDFDLESLGTCHGEIIGLHFFEHIISGATVPSGSFVRISWKHSIKYQNVGFSKMELQLHFHHDVRTFLDKQYPNCWIGRGGSILWPPRSLGLNPLDFFSGVIRKILFT